VQHDDVQKFFAVITDVRDRAMFLLALKCGLRISEVASLKLTDLYLDEEHPRLVAPGKGSKERSVYLSPHAEWACRAYLNERPQAAGEFVFLSYQRNNSWSQSTTSFKSFPVTLQALFTNLIPGTCQPAPTF